MILIMLILHWEIAHEESGGEDKIYIKKCNIYTYTHLCMCVCVYTYIYKKKRGSVLNREKIEREIGGWGCVHVLGV